MAPSNEAANEATVWQLWDSFERRDFAAARSLLHDDFEALWPHTGERIRGADNFIAVNEHYPGNWSIRIERIVSAADVVVSEVTVPVDGLTFKCASLFEIRDGKIAKATDYWIQCNSEAAPAWRRPWTEAYTSR